MLLDGESRYIGMHLTTSPDPALLYAPHGDRGVLQSLAAVPDAAPRRAALEAGGQPLRPRGAAARSRWWPTTGPIWGGRASPPP